MSARDWNYHDVGDWLIRTQPSQQRRSEWFGEAKRKADGPFAEHALAEPINCDIYFEWADTESDVVLKLKRELLH